MDEAEFYFCAQMFLEKLGYIVDIEHAEVNGVSEKEENARELMEYGVKAANIIFDIDLKEPLYIGLGKIGEKRLATIKQDWNVFKTQLPIAGLMYSSGKPNVFGVKICDFMNEEELNSLYKSIDKLFLEFCNKYQVAITQMPNYLTLCLAFNNPESLKVADDFLKQGGHNLHFMRSTFAETWILDLNTLDIDPGRGFMGTMDKVMKPIVGPINQKLSETFKTQRVKMPADKPVNAGYIANINTKIFVDYITIYSSLIEKGELSIPCEVREKFEPEKIRIKLLSIRSKIRNISLEIESQELALGQEVFTRYSKGDELPTMSRQLDQINHCQQATTALRENIHQLVAFRETWNNAKTTEKSLKNNIGILERQISDMCTKLASTLFYEEIDNISGDPILKQIYERPLAIYDKILDREKEIAVLKNKRAGFFDSAKYSLTIAYIKGLIQTDYIQIDGHWKDIGRILLGLGQRFNPSGNVSTQWNKITESKSKYDMLKINLSENLSLQNEVAEKVLRITPGGTTTGCYPWTELENSLKNEIANLQNIIPDHYLALGKSYFNESSSVDRTSIIQSITNLKDLQNELIQQADDINKQDLACSLTKNDLHLDVHKPNCEDELHVESQVIIEEDGTVSVIVKLPGVKKECIDLTVDENAVYVSTKNGKNLHKRMKLDFAVDPMSAKASYVNGKLIVHINKKRG